MSSIDISPTSDIQFSVRAADKVSQLIAEENNLALNLRISIIGGGCSGFQYNFGFDEQINEDDTQIVQACSDGHSKVRLVIDSMSIQYLGKAEIDYSTGIQGEQFIIRNSKAQTTCGCGSSFSIEEDDD
ncbi:MAG: iron-sulfur cluster insertion protein ErpA [Legionella sp.]|nr:iron-sulfur cluster insertion protein ErpA [Legionella sp.]